MMILSRLLLLLLLLSPLTAKAADRYFTASDGTRLHYVDTGSGGGVLVMVPGWTMPAWIFQQQIDALSRQYRVVVLDPRGQGGSDIAARGYTAERRAQDIADLLAEIHVTANGTHAVLLGWSLGVLDSLAYVHLYGDGSLDGLVLIDNSIGEDPPPAPIRPVSRPHRRLSPEAARRAFVAAMFHRPQPASFIDRLTEASLRTPPWAASALLSYRQPRDYWKDAVYSTRKPILYAVTPRLAGQARNLSLRDPAAETVVFTNSGHALFIDEADRFDALLAGFLRRVWPTGPGLAKP